MAWSQKERNITTLGVATIGAVFAVMSWMESRDGLALFFLVVPGGLALFVQTASDDELNRLTRWFRWFH